jgi:nicotinate-nucleotide adenylyltransferase
MRVALLGGTFDPIHRGHLAIAAAAADAFTLDRVLFAPTGRQPLKLEEPLSRFSDRLAMTALACALDARFAVTAVDAPHPDGSPNYSVDSISALREQMPDAKLFVLVGADSFLDLPRWHQPERLLELAEWIVVSRPGFALDQIQEQIAEQVPAGRVHLLESVHEDVSATELRQRLERGDPCRDLIPATVLEYIRGHGLYR